MRSPGGLALALVCLLGIAWAPAARAGEPAVNFTSRKKVSLPEPVPPPEPAPPVVRAEPVESPAEPAPEVPVPVPEESVPVEQPPAPPVPDPLPVSSPVEVPAAVSSMPTPVALPPVVSPETVWLDDDLPAGAVQEGPWVWDSAQGPKAHGHPSEKGIHSHGLHLAQPAAVPLHGMIAQQVWLDPKDPPRGMALQFQLSTGEKVGVYWEGEEEVFNPAEFEELWYYGMLPELGKWLSLDILAEDLGLEDRQVTGLMFVTFDGRALWDKTSLKEAPPLEEPAESPEAPPRT
jgi:hypothetical protein